jgi:hypothetical protein
MSTIPTTLAPTITDFTPSITMPSFSSQISEVLTVTTLGAGAKTLTAAQILGGFIIGVPTAAANYTTDTAKNIVNAIQNAQVGSAIQFTVRNGAAGAYPITLVAGTGVTLNSGDTATVAQSNQKTFLAIVTALPNYLGVGAAVTIYSMGTVVF